MILAILLGSEYIGSTFCNKQNWLWWFYYLFLNGLNNLNKAYRSAGNLLFVYQNWVNHIRGQLTTWSTLNHQPLQNLPELQIILKICSWQHKIVCLQHAPIKHIHRRALLWNLTGHQLSTVGGVHTVVSSALAVFFPHSICVSSSETAGSASTLVLARISTAK